jgi:hypothetical protein
MRIGHSNSLDGQQWIMETQEIHSAKEITALNNKVTGPRRPQKVSPRITKGVTEGRRAEAVMVSLAYTSVL